jgi:hypothetical protein
MYQAVHGMDSEISATNLASGPVICLDRQRDHVYRSLPKISVSSGYANFEELQSGVPPPTQYGLRRLAENIRLANQLSDASGHPALTSGKSTRCLSRLRGGLWQKIIGSVLKYRSQIPFWGHSQVATHDTLDRPR